MKIYFILIVIFLCALQRTQSQNNEGVPCDTPNQEYGICTNLNKCSLLLNLLLTQYNNPSVRNYLKASACGFVGKDPLVCCPQSTPPTPSPTPSPVTTPPVSHTSTASPRNVPSPLPREPNCGLSNNSDSRIVNGVPAKLGEFPWMTALGYRNSKNPSVPKWLCGGSLITSRHILTAAHCVHNRQDLYIARLGDLDLYSDDDGAKPETIPLVKAKVHEDYSPVTYTNDIAILTLAESPKSSAILPICLPFEEPLRSRDYTTDIPLVAGWGAVSFNGPTSSTLLKTMIPIAQNKECKRAFANSRSIIDDRVLCAGYTRGGKDACQGDSGGPLMYSSNIPDSTTSLRMYQIGVVSYGFKCAEPGYPGVYTKMPAFIDWIEKNVS